MSNTISNDILLLIAIIAIIAFFVYKWRKVKQEEDEEALAETQEQANPKPRKPLRCTDEIVCSALRELQCVPEIKDIDENTCHILFEFQTEKFLIVCGKKNRFIHLYDIWWYSFSLEDIDQLAKVKRVINEMNWQSDVNTSYEVKEETKQVGVNISCGMVCLDEIDFKEYLRSTIHEAFATHYQFFRMLSESK